MNNLSHQILFGQIVAYPPDMVGRSMFESMSTESIMKELVRYNATPDATTGNGRIRTVDGWKVNVQIEPDQGRGTLIQKFRCAYYQLDEALNQLASVDGSHFEFVDLGNGAIEFRYLPPPEIAQSRWRRRGANTRERLSLGGGWCKASGRK